MTHIFHKTYFFPTSDFTSSTARDHRIKKSFNCRFLSFVFNQLASDCMSHNIQQWEGIEKRILKDHAVVVCGKSWNWAEATWNDWHLKWKIEWYFFMAIHKSQKFSQRNNITLIMLSNMENFLVRWGGFLVFRRHRLSWFMIFASLAAADIVVMWCCLYAMGRKKFLGLSLFFFHSTE